MPSLSTVNYQDLLQKITALEMKVHRIEVNVEVNGLCGNEITLPVTQNSGDKQANTRLKGKDNMTKHEAACVSKNKPSSDNSPWNSLGAKPKSKSCSQEKGGHGADRATISEADWPSPAVTRNKTVNKKASYRPPKQQNVKLQNRFAALSEDPRSLSDDHPSQGSGERTGDVSESERSQRKLRKLKPGPRTLIVGDSTVKDIQWMCGKNTRVLCFPEDMVSDMQKRILKVVTEYPSMKNIVLHTGSNDVSKEKSEVLKRDFTELINTVRSLDAVVYISGPVPPISGGDLRFSRLLALNKWLAAACTDNKLHFINNFHILCERRHLFKANGFNLNRQGVRLLASNIFHFLRHPSGLGTKTEICTVLSQSKKKTESEKDNTLPPPGGSTQEEKHQKQEEESLLTLDSTHSQDSCHPPTSSPQLSPSSPHLRFTTEMMERVNLGLRLTPQRNPLLLSPILPPPERSKEGRPPQPHHPPIPPPRLRHAQYPKSDV